MYSQRKIEHSQNFIRSSNLVRELLDLTNISSGDLVVEIGAGQGVITQELLRRARYVIAVEKDPRLAEKLYLLANQDKLQVVTGDFLQWHLPSADYKVFSNPPFNYTADIVRKLTSSYGNLPTDIYLIMQEAAAHRFAGMPYTRNSQISVLLSVDFEVKILREIDPNCFKPRPNVSIVFVHFSKRITPLVVEKDRQDFRDFVVYGYNQWAPTILDAFHGVFSKKQIAIIERTQQLAGLKPSDLTIEQWLELFMAFDKYVSIGNKQRVYGSEERLRKTQARLTKLYRTRKSSQTANPQLHSQVTKKGDLS